MHCVAFVPEAQRSIYIYIYICRAYEKREKNYDILSICEISSCTATFGRFPFGFRMNTIHIDRHTYLLVGIYRNCMVFLTSPIVGACCVCLDYDDVQYSALCTAQVVFIRQEVWVYSFISLIIIFQFRNVRMLFTYLQQVHIMTCLFLREKEIRKIKVYSTHTHSHTERYVEPAQVAVK